MSKEAFKRFVRSHPSLISHVNRGTMTWQKFYEMYDLYGENHSTWAPYFEEAAIATTAAAATKSSTLGDTSLKEIFNMVKQMDLETVRKGVDGLQKAVGLLQDFTTSKKQDQYQARPLYKHLED